MGHHRRACPIRTRQRKAFRTKILICFCSPMALMIFLIEGSMNSVPGRICSLPLVLAVPSQFQSRHVTGSVRNNLQRRRLKKKFRAIGSPGAVRKS